MNYVQMDIGDEQLAKKIVNHVELGCLEMYRVVRLLKALVQTAMREQQRPILAKIPVQIVALVFTYQSGTLVQIHGV